MKRLLFISMISSTAILNTYGLLAEVVSISPTEQKITNYVDAHNEEAISLLETTVNINSGTMNPEGVKEVGRVFKAEFDLLGFETLSLIHI